MFHGEGSEGRVMTYSSFLCLLILGKDKKNSDCEDSMLQKNLWIYLLFQRRWSGCCQHQFEYMMKLCNHFSLVLSSLQ